MQVELVVLFVPLCLCQKPLIEKESLRKLRILKELPRPHTHRYCHDRLRFCYQGSFRD